MGKYCNCWVVPENVVVMGFHAEAKPEFGVRIIPFTMDTELVHDKNGCVQERYPEGWCSRMLHSFVFGE